MPGFQFYFELIGAVAFAISGAALAVKKHMDLFGVAMMGMTTAVGGRAARPPAGVGGHRYVPAGVSGVEALSPRG